MQRVGGFLAGCCALLSVTLVHVQAQDQVQPAPDRGENEGAGPFDRLVIRGATLINGDGGMPVGPVDIVIEQNRIESIKGVGTPGIPISDEGRPEPGTHEIDAHGMYVMPGFIDNHVHTGGVPKAPNADYVYRLWLAHGITTVRGVPFGPLEWSISEKERSASNAIVAPRMVSFHRMGSGEAWKNRSIRTPDEAREWVRYAKTQGVDGLKLGAHRPDIMAALIDEANKLGMGQTAHLDQRGVARMNALDAARLGMRGMTHFYGLFEALYDDHDVQPWPAGINYANEYDRFSQVARQWNLITEPGSESWNAVLDEFIERDFIINPTMTIYAAGRNVEFARQSVWHDAYTLPSMMEYYRASRTDHGAYWFYWTTADEVAWRNFYQRWMAFLDDYKDRGGRVTIGTDAGFIYKLFGFSYVEEMELLQEAGFHPLEVIRAATLHGAEEIFEPQGKPIEYGLIQEGLLADLVIVEENPLENFKVLYGTGAVKLNDETRRPERIGGVKYTIKDGIVYDARQLLADVARMVETAKQADAEGSAEAK
ncbi:amidohydrolase family protein [Chromatocurvus halotolerans]|uniref:Amidohydrolase family protein n=1 Tax=Chromatocurvus halotolerans TaxID=1132028 RepID=A0A4R2KXT0_9GAMM|nr:amidohydrolase family protein [Chromatocurvus halotolerans]TCO77707.1 amidohydrolase family protein [Chromatocurvus halotolerans]